MHKEMAKDVWELGEFIFRLMTNYEEGESISLEKVTGFI